MTFLDEDTHRKTFLEALFREIQKNKDIDLEMFRKFFFECLAEKEFEERTKKVRTAFWIFLKCSFIQIFTSAYFFFFFTSAQAIQNIDAFLEQDALNKTALVRLKSREGTGESN